MRSLLPLLTLSLALVNAISFTAPYTNSTLRKGSTYDLSWTSVDTDVTSFSIYLVNFINWPPFYTPIEHDVETASGETRIRIPCSIDSSYGYQFNAMNGSNLYIIYAQSPKFYVTGNNTCTNPPSTSSACARAPIATVTVKASSNSSLSAAPTSAPTVLRPFAGTNIGY